MAGQIHKMINTLIERRSKGNTTIAITTKTKLIFKGINPELYTAQSSDDPNIMKKIKDIAAEMGVTLN